MSRNGRPICRASLFLLDLGGAQDLDQVQDGEFAFQDKANGVVFQQSVPQQARGKRGDTVRRSSQENTFTCHTRWQGSILHPLLTHHHSKDWEF